MKKCFLFLAYVILFSSCYRSKTEIVKDFIEAKECYDTEKLNRYLTDDFIYYYDDTSINKSEYLDKTEWALFKTIEEKTILLKIQDLDSIIKTEETGSSIVDSLLGVKPKIVLKRTYRFSGDKLKSITVDTILNKEEYLKSYGEKYTPFAFYVQDKYGIQDELETSENIIKYLKEYVSLSASDRKRFNTYASLQGTYVSKDNPFYRELIFKGKKTVSIVDAIFGIPFATSYVVDENFIRIRTDKSDLLFELIDNNTLIGEGFAKGTFTKSK